jgi:phosphate transport system ATP-binding protein
VTSATGDDPAGAGPKISVSQLCAWFGPKQVLRDIDIDIEARSVTAIIGPSGCGKSTFIRCINRLHEMAPDARMTGQIRVDGAEIQGLEVDPLGVRRRVGMVFSEPNPFPGMSIRENVLAGLRLTGERVTRARGDEIVERALRQAALWDEVRDRLGARGTKLPSGQQQRLCIARTLAVEPEIVLMDEPCSALDPVATAKVEDLLHELREHYTVVIVTHSLQQAARVSERAAFFMAGELVEYDDTDTIFTAPHDKRTEDYITGKFG